MSNILTFLDSNVLIAAYSSKPDSKDLALALVKDKSRSFVVSPLLELETLPYAGKQTAELRALRIYFDTASIRISDLEEMSRIAGVEIERSFGLAPVDALHIAAAHIAGAEVLITLENETKPMYRTSLVRVAHLKSVLTAPPAP